MINPRFDRGFTRSRGLDLAFGSPTRAVCHTRAPHAAAAAPRLLCLAVTAAAARPASLPEMVDSAASPPPRSRVALLPPRARSLRSTAGGLVSHDLFSRSTRRCTRAAAASYLPPALSLSLQQGRLNALLDSAARHRALASVRLRAPTPCSHATLPLSRSACRCQAALRSVRLRGRAAAAAAARAPLPRCALAATAIAVRLTPCFRWLPAPPSRLRTHTRLHVLPSRTLGWLAVTAGGQPCLLVDSAASLPLSFSHRAAPSLLKPAAAKRAALLSAGTAALLPLTLVHARRAPRRALAAAALLRAKHGSLCIVWPGGSASAAVAPSHMHRRVVHSRRAAAAQRDCSPLPLPPSHTSPRPVLAPRRLRLSIVAAPPTGRLRGLPRRRRCRTRAAAA